MDDCFFVCSGVIYSNKCCVSLGIEGLDLAQSRRKYGSNNCPQCFCLVFSFCETELPDDFFEVTDSDVKSLYKDLQKQA